MRFLIEAQNKKINSIQNTTHAVNSPAVTVKRKTADNSELHSKTAAETENKKSLEKYAEDTKRKNVSFSPERISFSLICFSYSLANSRASFSIAFGVFLVGVKVVLTVIFFPSSPIPLNTLIRKVIFPTLLVLFQFLP